MLLTAAIPTRTLTIQIATILSRRVAIQDTHQARTFALLYMQPQQQQRASENSNSNRPLSCDANVPTAYLKCILGPLLFLLHLHPSAVPPSLPSRYLRSSDPPTRISFSLDFNPVSRLRLQFHRSFFPARETEVRLTSRKSQAHSPFTQQSLPRPADTSRRRGTKP